MTDQITSPKKHSGRGGVDFNARVQCATEATSPINQSGAQTSGFVRQTSETWRPTDTKKGGVHM